MRGDYLHANPNKYKADDFINYYGGRLKVADIWEKDRLKKEYAKSKGYNLFIIWDSQDLLTRVLKLKFLLGKRDADRTHKKYKTDN